jgi:hypothetical protein
MGIEPTPRHQGLGKLGKIQDAEANHDLTSGDRSHSGIGHFDVDWGGSRSSTDWKRSTFDRGVSSGLNE